MDSDTTIEDLKAHIKKFNADRDWDQFHNAKDLAIAISTEAAEVINISSSYI